MVRHWTIAEATANRNDDTVNDEESVGEMIEEEGERERKSIL